MSDSRKLVIVLTNHGGNETATVGFTIANMALSRGREVGIFLTADGVELAREGGAGMSHVRPFHPLHELIEEFEANGGVIWACSPCFRHRGHDAGDTLDNVEVTTAATMLDWLDEGAATLCF